MASLQQKPSMKERILETADKLFYLRGIRAIGVDTIAAEIGISKRTLYNHFPSKDALITAYLERRFVQPRPSDKPPAEPRVRRSRLWFLLVSRNSQLQVCEAHCLSRWISSEVSRSAAERSTGHTIQSRAVSLSAQSQL